MLRNIILTMAAYHEIGHYLMLKRFQKVLDSKIRKIIVRPFGLGVDGTVFCSVFVENSIETESIEFIEDLICVYLSGYVATQIVFNYSSEISEHSDRVQADYLAGILEKRYKSIGMSKSKEDIIKKQRANAKEYLASKRFELESIAKILLKQRILTSNRLKIIEKEYSL